jgi:aminoglycoside 3-N-acetyltransferase
MFPTHTGTPDVSPQNPPTFDVLNSESVRIGFVPNFVRKQPGAIRSLHATHSVVAFGDSASSYLESHFASETPCDRLSPYGKLAEDDGLIVLVGCTHSSNTCLHWVEELCGCNYHLLPDFGESTIIDSFGIRRYQRSRYHSWETPRDFEKIEESLISEGIQNNHQFNGVTIRTISAQKMTRWVEQQIRNNPMFLVK